VRVGYHLGAQSVFATAPAGNSVTLLTEAVMTSWNQASVTGSSNNTSSSSSGG
jgi:hypothetical protein